MASRCGRGRSLLSTPPWCHHCVLMGLPGHGLLTMMGPHSRMLVVAKSARTPN